MDDGERLFTRRQLARYYNGAGSNPAYIAVEGVVYDVTRVPSWAGGMNDGMLAGKDYTEEFQEAGADALRDLRRNAQVVGRLSEEE
jgi:predicted heme/steroid binding protein